MTACTLYIEFRAVEVEGGASVWTRVPRTGIHTGTGSRYSSTGYTYELRDVRLFRTRYLVGL